MVALYNKYRPKNFSELIGQDHVAKPLSAALDNNKTHHAYLFSGPRGCGKTSASRILAKSLNCQANDAPTSTPCEVCQSCVSINNGSSLDVTEIDAASNGGVDNARDLRQKASTRPNTARYRIVIIDEAHMVTNAAFNALLKVVEEPPEYLKFIFATTEPDKVIGTIRSRTFQYPFRLVPGQEMLEHVKKIAELENVKVEDDAYPFIIRNGGGSVRDTLSTFDQLLSGKQNEVLTSDETISLLGMTDSSLLETTLEAIIKRDASNLFAIIEKVAKIGLDISRFTNDVLNRLRDLLILKAVPDGIEKGLLGALSSSETTSLKKQAVYSDVSSLTRAGKIFDTALTDMRSASNPRLSLELAIAEIISGEDERLSRIEKVLKALYEKVQNVPVSNTPENVSSTPVAPAPAPALALASVAAVEGTPREQNEAPEPVNMDVKPLPPTPNHSSDWVKVLDVIKTRTKAAAALLEQYAEVENMKNNELTLVFSTAGIMKAYSPHEKLVLETLNETLGGSWNIVTKAK